MGSVCSTLSSLQAGIAMRIPVARHRDGTHDIGRWSGPSPDRHPGCAEDGFGDMDFKVASTRDFITALQLDTARRHRLQVLRRAGPRRDARGVLDLINQASTARMR